MNTRLLTKKHLIGVALTGALGLASSSAMATVYNDFMVDFSTLAGNTYGTNTFTADKITGNYSEVITFSPTSATTGTFAVSLEWQAAAFVANDGTSQLSGLQSGLGTDYGIYALYMNTGTYSSNAAGTITSFFSDPLSGSLNVYIDALMGNIGNLTTIDTSGGAPGTGDIPINGSTAWTTSGNTADDYKIATGTPYGGQGTLDTTLSTCSPTAPTLNCGSFGTSTSFDLTNPAGTSFFYFPSPFYQVSFQAGQLNNFDVSGTQLINGSMDVTFSNPEPASVALIGLGLAGMGLTMSKRRRNKKSNG